MRTLISRVLGAVSHKAKDNGRAEQLNALKASSFSGGGKLHRVISDVLNVRLTDEERRWVDRIERLRNELASQEDRLVTFSDFGAGKPGQEYTPEESARGVSVTRSVAEMCRQGGLSSQWLLFLFKLTREFQPGSLVELGTSLGMSAAYQGAALTLNDNGRLITLEGAENLAKIAQENWMTLGLAECLTVVTGRFQDTLDGVFLRAKPVDYAFIDGHHDEEATVAYFSQFLPHLASEAVLVFDDIMYYEGMKRAWKRIVSHPASKIAIDLGIVGVVIVSAQSATKEYYTIHL